MDKMRSRIISACMGLRWHDSTFNGMPREEAEIYFHQLSDEDLLDKYDWFRYLETRTQEALSQ